MERTDVNEVFYIVTLENVPAIVANGILSARRAHKVPHKSIASTTILARRANKPVSPTRSLPDYVNLYFCARNKMMSGLLWSGVKAESLCVLTVSSDVLDVDDAAIADGNASSDWHGGPITSHFCDEARPDVRCR